MQLEYLELDSLEAEAQKLSHTHQIAFASSICERLLPNYEIYARESSWDTYSLLKTSLNEVWLLLEGKPLDELKLRQLIIDCEKVGPDDVDNHYSSYVEEAQYAAASVCNVLDLCLESNSIFVRRVAACAHNTLYIYLSWQLNESYDDWGKENAADYEKKTFEEQLTIVANHPFTVREMAKENEVLQHLKATPTLTKDFLQWLRTYSQNNGKSLIYLA